MPNRVCYVRQRYKIDFEIKIVEMPPHMSSSVCSDAIELLSKHRFTPDTVLFELEKVPSIILHDDEANKWTFIKRHQTRRYLMVKNNNMLNYMEIYSCRN